MGFEPTASWSRTRRSTKLSHSPKSIDEARRQVGARACYFAYFAADGKGFETPGHVNEGCRQNAASATQLAAGVAVLVSSTEIKYNGVWHKRLYTDEFF